MSKMTLRKWYGSSITIPGYNSWNYGPFVASCLGIAKTVLEDYAETKVRIAFTGVETGAMDKKNAVIRLNRAYLMGIAPEISDKQLDSDDAISLILGLTTHEVMHYAWSPDDLSPWGDYIKGRTRYPYLEQVALVLGNIVEDIWGESEVDRRVPSLTWTLERKNELYFHNRTVEERWLKVKDIQDAPESPAAIPAILNLLILANVKQSLIEVDCEENPYLEKLFKMTREAVNCTQVKQTRYQLALDLYNEIGRNLKPSECKNYFDSAEMKEVAKEAKGAGGAFEAGEAGKKGESVAVSSMYAEIGDIETEVERMNSFRILSWPDEFTDNRAVYYEMEMKKAENKIELDKRYIALAELARQKATVNRPYGQDRNRGHNIRKLYRIGTDSKIFAEPSPTTNFQPMEVVILLDCSGSMSSEVRRGKRRIDLALEAGLGAATGLVEGRSRVAVFGHTAHVFNEEVVIYKFKGFNDPIYELPYRLFEMHNQRRSQNKDGYAITYCGKQFVTPGRKKVLIVISDGQPAAPQYMGQGAWDHCNRCVNELRRSKIDVLSISITEESRKVNDIIYGAQYNTYNEDPNVIEQIIRSLMN